MNIDISKKGKREEKKTDLLNNSTKEYTKCWDSLPVKYLAFMLTLFSMLVGLFIIFLSNFSCHRFRWLLGWRRWNCFRFYTSYIHVSWELSASLRQLSVPFLQWQDCGSQHAPQHEWLMQTTVLCCLLSYLHWCCVCCSFTAWLLSVTINLISFFHGTQKNEILKTAGGCLPYNYN